MKSQNRPPGILRRGGRKVGVVGARSWGRAAWGRAAWRSSVGELPGEALQWDNNSEEQNSVGRHSCMNVKPAIRAPGDEDGGQAPQQTPAQHRQTVLAPTGELELRK